VMVYKQGVVSRFSAVLIRVSASQTCAAKGLQGVYLLHYFQASTFEFTC
jgi:hypothetical protein